MTKQKVTKNDKRCSQRETKRQHPLKKNRNRNQASPQKKTETETRLHSTSPSHPSPISSSPMLLVDSFAAVDLPSAPSAPTSARAGRRQERSASGRVGWRPSWESGVGNRWKTSYFCGKSWVEWPLFCW